MSTVEMNVERDCSALGGLFQAIINDMKGSSPVWEDFNAKATKLNSAIRNTMMAASAFLESFQRVADMATNSKGATRDMGSSLTRLCLRHKSIENKLKSFSVTLMDGMVGPLQQQIEEWKKSVLQLDKEHAKEYKKARNEIKKASSDTVRLQKKVKKGKSDMQNRLENAMQDINDKYLLLEETEKTAVRGAMIEERSRFCTFVNLLKPVVDEEISMLTEITHLQEIMETLNKQATDPHTLPQSSEQVLVDLKSADDKNLTFHTPPSSPSSLGSRKSSMCSINSITSNSSGSSKSHSPSHHFRYRNPQQQQAMSGTLRLSSVSSQDSGFTSQDTLFLKPLTPPPPDFRNQLRLLDTDSNSSTAESSNASTPCSPYPAPPSATSTWTNWPEAPKMKIDPGPEFERPHTISSAYEKTHTRPPLTAQLFEPPSSQMMGRPKTPPNVSHYQEPYIGPPIPKSQTAPSTPYRTTAGIVPVNKPQVMREARPNLGPKLKAKPVATPKVPVLTDYNAGGAEIAAQPLYVNMNELASMVAQQHKVKMAEQKNREQQQEQQQHQQQQQQQLLLQLQEHPAPPETIPESKEESHYASSEVSDGPTSSELAEAIRELEASTAALEDGMTGSDDGSGTSRSSLQRSSGYGTMNSTPACSEGTIDVEDIETPSVEDNDSEKYMTLPRSGDVSNFYPNGDVSNFKRPSVAPKRPASTAGVPTQGAVRRASMTGPKPPPPVRRNSSISSGQMTAPRVLSKTGEQINGTLTTMEEEKMKRHTLEKLGRGHQDGQGQHEQRRVSGPPIHVTQSDPSFDKTVVPSRASIIQSLNAKFAQQHELKQKQAMTVGQQQKQTPVCQGAPVTQQQKHSAPSQYQGELSTQQRKQPPPTQPKQPPTQLKQAPTQPKQPPPTAKKPVVHNHMKETKKAEPDRNNLLSQIRNGLALKKVETNDRSMPRIS